MSDNENVRRFSTDGMIGLLKSVLDGGEMIHKYNTTEDGERTVREWGFKHGGTDDDLRQAIRECPELQRRFDRLSPEVVEE